MARGDSGQAAVEAALTLPLLIVAGACALQLAAIQQARLFVEYAATCAVRAGIVWSGNPERMRDAALFALVPVTAGGPLGNAWERTRRLDSDLQDVLPPPDDAPAVMREARLLGLVRVDPVVYGPRDWPAPELDFDALGATDALLGVRVRLWYELRIPVASSVLFHAWFAANALGTLHGGLQFGGGTVRTTSVDRAGDRAEHLDQARAISHGSGWPSASGAELRTIWKLATGGLQLSGGGRRLFLPLHASSVRRMQSNLYEKWRVHREVP